MEKQFKVKNILNYKDINIETIIPQSHISIQTDSQLIQFDEVETLNDDKIEILPGSFLLNATSNGIHLESMQLMQRDLLLEISNTANIMYQANSFFNNLQIYEQIKQPKKRGVLLYSEPGMGKSATIEAFCYEMSQKDSGAVIINWPTSSIDAEDLYTFFTINSFYNDKCTCLILIVEDIGGTATDDMHPHSSSALLNLLDGQGQVFQLPTFIVATTNHPHTLLKSLADRPGRFDLMLELEKLTALERCKLVSFFAKRSLTSSEIKCLEKKDLDNFSVAHLKEIVIRSLIHDKTFDVVINEILAHTKKFKKQFSKSNSDLGL